MDEPNTIADSLIQQSLLLQLVDRAPALVFIADDRMRYLAVNATACSTLGYTREELLSLCVTDVAVDDDAADLYQEMIETRALSGTTNIRTKDGRLLPFRYVAHETEIARLRYYIAVGFVDDTAATATRSAARTADSAARN
jgi:PAS domain S-box-containing protein